MARGSQRSAPPTTLATLGVFTVVYVIALVLVMAVTAVTGISANSGASIGALMGAAAYAGMGHARKAGSPPVGRQLGALVFGSFVLSTLVSIALVAGALILGGGVAELRTFMIEMSELFGTLSPGFLAAGAAFITLVYVLSLWLGYGWLTRMSWKRQNDR